MTREPARAEVTTRVRKALGTILGGPIDGWPVDRPLDEVPGATYDSVTRVEAVAAVEDEFDLAVEVGAPEDLATVSAIVDLVVRTGQPRGLAP